MRVVSDLFVTQHVGIEVGGVTATFLQGKYGNEVNTGLWDI